MRALATAFDAVETVAAGPDNGPDAALVTIPDAHFLFHAEFKRTGSDLTLTGQDGHRLVVPGYFNHDRLPTLVSPEGAALTGDLVSALAGPLAPGQYAQAGAPVNAAPPIGRVATVQGDAVAVRNGVAVTLNVGDVVLKGDVIQTQGNSAVGIIFPDGTTFSLTANARMVLNEFVYSPASTSNSAVINLVQGSITFLAGEVAKTGDMRVGTPAAVMGIRGTAVQVDIDVNNGTTKMSVLVEPSGVTGSFNVFSLSGVLLGVVNNSSTTTVITPISPLQATLSEVVKSPADLQQALQIIQQVVQTQAVGNAIMQQQPLPPAPGAPPDPNNPNPNQNPTSLPPGTQITTTFPTQVSTTTIQVSVTTTPTNTTVTNVQTNPPQLPNTPPTQPFVPENPNTPPADQPPAVAHAIADQSTPQGSTWSFHVPATTFSDADSGFLTLSATMSDGTALPTWLHFDPATATFSSDPVPPGVSSVDIKVSASDGSQSASDTFTLVINAPPVAHDDTATTHTENFNHPGLGGWTAVSLGNAAMFWFSNGHEAVEQSNSGTGFLKAPVSIAPPGATAYTINVDVNPNVSGFGDSHTNNGVGVVFGYANGNDYYRAYWADYGTDYFNSDHRDLILSHVVNGVETVLDRVDNIDLGSGEIHFQVVVNPDGTTVNVTGSEHSAQLASAAAPALGGTGLFTDNNDDGVAYDNFSVAIPATLSTNEDTALTIPVAALLANDTDADDPHSALTITGVTDGHAVLNGDGTITFTPGANYNGPANFSYTVSDGHPGGTSTATVNLTINAVNDAPVLAPGSNVVSYTEHGPALQLLPTATVTDPDGTNFNGGSVSVTLSDAVAGDELVLAGFGGVTMFGNSVRVNGSTVGTISGNHSDHLTITFTSSSNSTDANVDAVLQAVAYDSSSDNPTPVDRTATVTFNDGGNGGPGALSDSSTVTIHVTPTGGEFPVIHTPDGGIQYWASNTTGDVTPINHISFDDPDSNTGPVWVTFTMNDNGDALDATNLSGSGVSVVSGNGSSQLKLAGTIADINSYLFHGNLLWNPDGFSDHEGGLLTVRIDDNGSAPGGNVTTATVGISEISDPNFSGSSTQNFSDVNFTQIGTVSAGNGNDTVTTSWSHQGATTIYDGGTGSDTIHLEFTPDQLSEILNSLTLRSDLRSYIDDPSGDTLDLSSSSWHAEAKNFEHADVNLVTDSGSDDISVNSFFTSLPFAGSPTSGNDLILGTSGNDSTLGGASGSPGNDIVVGLAGNDTISGGSGNDLLLGGTGNDILIGGTGNDILAGSGGADIFRFTELTAGGAPNFGKDIIVDFHPGEDSIEIDPAIFSDFAALKAALADDAHGNAVITANAANTITLEGVSAATVIAHQSDIHFGAILAL